MIITQTRRYSLLEMKRLVTHEETSNAFMKDMGLNSYSSLEYGCTLTCPADMTKYGCTLTCPADMTEYGCTLTCPADMTEYGCTLTCLVDMTDDFAVRQFFPTQFPHNTVRGSFSVKSWNKDRSA